MSTSRVFFVDNGVAVTEFAAQVHLDRDAGQFLDHELAHQASVSGGAAGHDDHLVDGPDVLGGERNVRQNHAALVRRYPAAEGVDDRAGLFEDFLLHEMLIPGLLGHDRVPEHLVHGFLDRRAFQRGEGDFFPGEDGDFAVVHVGDFPGMLQDGRHVRGDEGFALAVTHDERAFLARGDQHVRPLAVQDAQRVRAVHPLEGPPDRVFEAVAALAVVFDEMGNDFRVGLGFEFVPGSLEFFL